jgi:hypothetical protein
MKYRIRFIDVQTGRALLTFFRAYPWTSGNMGLAIRCESELVA